MKNYLVYCLFSNAVKFEGSLKECYAKLRNVGGFGIANATTGRSVCYRTINGFTLPKRFVERFPKKDQKLCRLSTWY